jgi:hypothetical protein
MQAQCVAAGGLPSNITDRLKVVVDCLSNKQACPPRDKIVSHGRDAVAQARAWLAEHGESSLASAQGLMETVFQNTEHLEGAAESQDYHESLGNQHSQAKTNSKQFKEAAASQDKDQSLGTQGLQADTNTKHMEEAAERQAERQAKQLSNNTYRSGLSTR